MTALLKLLPAILVKIFMKVAGEEMITWLLFYILEHIVKSTKTPHDNEIYMKMKQVYDSKSSVKPDTIN